MPYWDITDASSQIFYFLKVILALLYTHGMPQ